MPDCPQQKISLEQLQKVQSAGNVMKGSPSSWDILDIPAELKEAWKKYATARRDFMNLMDTYGLDTTNM